MQTNQFGEDVLHRPARHRTQHELLALLLMLGYQFGYMLRHCYGTFLAGLVDGGLHLLHPCDTCQFIDIFRLVQFPRHMTQRDL